MITIGVDAHKEVHVAVAVDDAGRHWGDWRGANTPEGWRSVFEWAQRYGDDREWGIEGAWGYGRGLAQELVGRRETVYEVNARWTAAGRRAARHPGKTDSLDAQSVARVVRQEGAALPTVSREDDSTPLDLLATERDDLVHEATRLRNQAHALLMQVDPTYRRRVPSLTTKRGLRALSVFESTDRSDRIQCERAAAVRRISARLQLALLQADDLARQIRALAADRYAALTELYGVDLLTAASIAGVLGPGQRFRTDAQLAAYAGVSPLETSSASIVRHRLNRGGNRRLNSIIYRIAITQARGFPPARAYLRRRMSEGKTKREAHRALRRHIVRAIWRLWRDCAEIPAGRSEAAHNRKRTTASAAARLPSHNAEYSAEVGS